MTTEQLNLIKPLVQRQDKIVKIVDKLKARIDNLKKESDALEFQIQGIVAGGQSKAEA